MAIHIDKSQTASWQRLIIEAQQKQSFSLSEDLESYLVFMLIRFTKEQKIAKSILAIEYLNSQNINNNTNKQEALRDVGDKCLLFSGFYPEQAQKRLVTLEYFITLGQGAYSQISEENAKHNYDGLAELFNNLAQNFIKLTNTLQIIKKTDDNNLILKHKTNFKDNDNIIIH